MGNVIRIEAGEQPLEGRTSGTLHTSGAVASEDGPLDIRPTGGHSRLATANDVAGGSLTAVTSQPALARLALQPGVALAGVVGTNLAALLIASEATGNCFRCVVYHGEDYSFRDIQVFGLGTSPEVFMLGINMLLLALGVWLLGRLPIIRRPGVRLSGRQRRGARELQRASVVAGLADFAVLAHNDTWGQAFNSQLIVATVFAFVLSLFVAAWKVRGGRMPRVWFEVGWQRAGQQAALPQAAKRQE